eukprot:TRINITY_DN26973_c0_g1_i1.p1 TRINITY_DN26973_c0_g1~~TRINITY_DN26973_c0_g1_i1.p1  ORF type:complete len:738 (-),score=217.23 TRINITY_DN26973_c0_g1_i1:137-2350(-)
MRSPGRRSAPTGGGAETPPSEKGMSLFGGDERALGMGAPGPGGFSAFPPLSAAAPSADLLSKLAYSEAKVRQLEHQLEDCELRWQQRLADAKLASEAEHERMELQCRRFEAELDRCKEIHAGDLRHLNETKQMLLQSFETEKESARREERRKAQLDLERVNADHASELDELRRKHERHIAIVQQQAELEAEGLRRAHAGESQLTKLVEQVKGSVAQVEVMSKRVDGDKSLEWSVRERQLEAREKSVKELEARASSQAKEVEEQRRRVSEMLRNMEESQVDDRSALGLERQRLEEEHKRLLTLQQGVRESDRNNKEALKHAWAQVEEERRRVEGDKMKLEGELSMRKEEVELQERQVRLQAEQLQALHEQVKVARQNASRRIRETETTVASERRCLMNDLEVFEEKRRLHSQEVNKFECEKNSFEEERTRFENEVRSVGQMAAEVERRSEEVRLLHDQAGEVKSELTLLRSQVQEERSAQGNELERLKNMQTLIEQQRLQLLQTENQFHLKGIEDIDYLVTTQASIPLDGAAGQQPLMLQQQTDLAVPGGNFGPTEPITSGAGDHWNRLQEKAPNTGALHGKRPLATPCRSGGSLQNTAGSRVELQTLLRRTREASGEMQIYIQEQCRFLRQVTTSSAPADQGQFSYGQMMSGLPSHGGHRAPANFSHPGMLGEVALAPSFSAGCGAFGPAHGSYPGLPTLSSAASSEDNDSSFAGGPQLEAFPPLSSNQDDTSVSTS